MPETNDKPSFHDLWLRIADRAYRGRKVVLTPATAAHVAHSMMAAQRASSEERFPFAIEQWSEDDAHLEEVMAKCRNSSVARAAFKAAVEQRPKSRIYLRNGVHVLEKYEPPSP
jgi:hypothetical protein